MSGGKLPLARALADQRAAFGSGGTNQLQQALETIAAALAPEKTTYPALKESPAVSSMENVVPLSALEAGAYILTPKLFHEYMLRAARDLPASSFKCITCICPWNVPRGSAIASPPGTKGNWPIVMIIGFIAPSSQAAKTPWQAFAISESEAADVVKKFEEDVGPRTFENAPVCSKFAVMGASLLWAFLTEYSARIPWPLVALAYYGNVSNYRRDTTIHEQLNTSTYWADLKPLAATVTATQHASTVGGYFNDALQKFFTIKSKEAHEAKWDLSGKRQNNEESQLTLAWAMNRTVAVGVAEGFQGFDTSDMDWTNSAQGITPGNAEPIFGAAKSFGHSLLQSIAHSAARKLGSGAKRAVSSFDSTGIGKSALRGFMGQDEEDDEQEAGSDDEERHPGAKSKRDIGKLKREVKHLKRRSRMESEESSPRPHYEEGSDEGEMSRGASTMNVGGDNEESEGEGGGGILQSAMSLLPDLL